MRVEIAITRFLLFTAFCFGWLHIANADLASGSDQLFDHTCDQLISLNQDAANHKKISGNPLEIQRRKTKGDAKEEQCAYGVCL